MRWWINLSAFLFSFFHGLRLLLFVIHVSVFLLFRFVSIRFVSEHTKKRFYTQMLLLLLLYIHIALTFHWHIVASTVCVCIQCMALLLILSSSFFFPSILLLCFDVYESIYNVTPSSRSAWKLNGLVCFLFCLIFNIYYIHWVERI